jgi:hypothetical protein
VIRFVPNEPVFAPIRTVYHFDLSLSDEFVRDCLHLTDAEDSHLRSQVAISKRWPTVSITMEDWRSHLVLKVNEGYPYSQHETDHEGNRLVPVDGPGWAYERRTREEMIYANNFCAVDLWRRYLCAERAEYLQLGIVDCWQIRLAALGGRFGSSWEPDRLESKKENSYLALHATESQLAPYSSDEPQLGRINTDFQNCYQNREPNGVHWRLTVINLQKYIEVMSALRWSDPSMAHIAATIRMLQTG